MSQKKSQDISARRRRKAQQKGKIPWKYLIPAIVVIVLIIGLAYVNSRSPDTSSTEQITTSLYPFACLGSEQLTFHIHIWLRIVINGQNITIPAAVGIVNPVFENANNEKIATGGSCFEPMHTHDDSGIIHVESATNINYTLGDFFDIWKVTYGNLSIGGVNHPIVLNSTDILGYKIDSTHKLVLLVDGASSSQYGSLVLNQYDYCSSTNQNVPPCFPSAGAPYWNGGNYPYETGHTILIEYETT
ncbi:MAG: hypothetical protein ACREBS_07355 [Nitrososphaerales archaeon]